MKDDLATLEHLLAGVFKTGTMVSGAMLAAGLLLSFLSPSSRATTILLGGGVLVLLVTPVARVLASFLDYLWMRDWWFALWTGIVLALLASSFLTALHV